MDNNFSIVTLILNKDRSKQTLSIIEQVRNNYNDNIEFVIIDDNSNDYHVLAENNLNDLFVYKYPEINEFGLIKKYNYGFIKAFERYPKYILVLQNDMEIQDNNLVRELVDYMETNNKCAVVGPTIYNGKGIKTWGGFDKYRMGHKINTSEAFLLRTICLEKFGLWNERLGYYYEDIEYFIRLKKQGYYTNSLESVSLIHYGGGTSSSFVNEKDYHRVRASLLFIKKFNKKMSMKTNYGIFISEINGQILRIKQHLKKLEIKQLVTIMYYMFMGLVSGLYNTLPEVKNIEDT